MSHCYVRCFAYRVTFSYFRPQRNEVNDDYLFFALRRCSCAPPLFLRRETVRSLTLFYVALCALALMTAPAFAGHYEITYTYAGTSTPGEPDGAGGMVTDWATGNGPLNSLSMGAIPAASASGTVTAKFTWKRDNLVDLTDIPPDKVYIIEAAGAYWGQYEGFYVPHVPPIMYMSGSADNGLGGTYVPHPDTGDGVVGGQSTGSRITEVNAGESFERTCTLSANAQADLRPVGHGEAMVSVSYSVGIIPTPYDFRVEREAIPDDPMHLYPQAPKLGVSYGGELYVPYKWKSTTGNLDDLSGCIIYEMLSFSGDGDDVDTSSGRRWFVPFNPPFLNSGQGSGPTSWANLNPYNSKEDYFPVPGTQGRILDRHSRGGYMYVPPRTLTGPGTISGRTSFSYEVRQNWVFDCPAANVLAKRVPSPTGESGLNTITRSYYQLGNEDSSPCIGGNSCDAWRYKTTKHNFVAWSDWVANITDGGVGLMVRDNYGTIVYP